MVARVHCRIQVLVEQEVAVVGAVSKVVKHKYPGDDTP